MFWLNRLQYFFRIIKSIFSTLLNVIISFHHSWLRSYNHNLPICDIIFKPFRFEKKVPINFRTTFLKMEITRFIFQYIPLLLQHMNSSWINYCQNSFHSSCQSLENMFKGIGASKKSTWTIYAITLFHTIPSR